MSCVKAGTLCSSKLGQKLLLEDDNGVLLYLLLKWP